MARVCEAEMTTTLLDRPTHHYHIIETRIDNVLFKNSNLDPSKKPEQ